MAPVFCNASLIALNKIKGGVHTIVVGEVLRRLVTKCIAKQLQSESAKLFSSKQLGVCVKSGAESFIHAIKIIYEKLQLSWDAGIF